jgi:DNA modification methylase
MTKHYSKNPRQITKKQDAALLASLDELGDLGGIVHDLDSDQIIGGNQRSRLFSVIGKTADELKAAGQLVIVRELPAPDRQGTVTEGYLVWKDARYAYRAVRWTPEQCEAANLRANMLGGAWDWDALAGFDASVLLASGFEQETLRDWKRDVTGLAALIESTKPEPVDAEPQISLAEQLQEKWQVRTGDIWTLDSGKGAVHRLACGDCTDSATVARVMGGEKAEIIFTSPPYADMRDYTGGDLSTQNLANFIPTWCEYANFQVVNLGIKRDGGEVKEYWNDYIAAARGCDLKLLSWNVWDKGRATSIATQSAMFALEHEFIFVFGVSDKTLNRTIEKSIESSKRLKYARRDSGGRKVRSVRQANGEFRDSVIGNEYQFKNMPSIVQCFPQMARDITTSHPAPFPVELPEIYIDAMTNMVEIVVDPFSGSGTTIIACENLSRHCRAIEISPAYCAVTLQRFQDATGATPTILERLP